MDVYKPHRKRYRKAIIISLVSIGLTSSLFLVGWDSSPVVDRTEIRIGEVSRSQFQVDVSATGILLSKKSGAITTRAGGFVVKRYISNGDYVQKGDLLFELDNPDLIIQYQDAQSEVYAQKSRAELERLELLTVYERHKANLVRARLELKNKEIEKQAKEILYTQKNSSISRMDFEKVLMEHEIAISSYESEKAIMMALEISRNAKLIELDYSEKKYEEKMSRLKSSVESLTIKAPHEGVVQDVSVDEGQRAELLALLCRIPDNHELYVSAQVPAFEIDKVKVGQSAQILVNQETVSATVNRIDPLVQSSMVNVDFSIDKIEGNYRVNTPVKVVISTEIKPDVMTVERPVNVRDNSKVYVYVLENKIARKQGVTFGVGSLTKIEVLSGLEVGQNIITSDISNIAQDSFMVRVQ